MTLIQSVPDPETLIHSVDEVSPMWTDYGWSYFRPIDPYIAKTLIGKYNMTDDNEPGREWVSEDHPNIRVECEPNNRWIIRVFKNGASAKLRGIIDHHIAELSSGSSIPRPRRRVEESTAVSWELNGNGTARTTAYLPLTSFDALKKILKLKFNKNRDTWDDKTGNILIEVREDDLRVIALTPDARKAVEIAAPPMKSSLSRRTEETLVIPVTESDPPKSDPTDECLAEKRTDWWTTHDGWTRSITVQERDGFIKKYGATLTVVGGHNNTWLIISDTVEIYELVYSDHKEYRLTVKDFANNPDLLRQNLDIDIDHFRSGAGYVVQKPTRPRHRTEESRKSAWVDQGNGFWNIDMLTDDMAKKIITEFDIEKTTDTWYRKPGKVIISKDKGMTTWWMTIVQELVQRASDVIGIKDGYDKYPGVRPKRRKEESMLVIPVEEKTTDWNRERFGKEYSRSITPRQFDLLLNDPSFNWEQATYQVPASFQGKMPTHCYMSGDRTAYLYNGKAYAIGGSPATMRKLDRVIDNLGSTPTPSIPNLNLRPRRRVEESILVIPVESDPPTTDLMDGTIDESRWFSARTPRNATLTCIVVSKDDMVDIVTDFDLISASDGKWVNPPFDSKEDRDKSFRPSMLVKPVSGGEYQVNIRVKRGTDDVVDKINKILARNQPAPPRPRRRVEESTNPFNGWNMASWKGERELYRKIITRAQYSFFIQAYDLTTDTIAATGNPCAYSETMDRFDQRIIYMYFDTDKKFKMEISGAIPTDMLDEINAKIGGYKLQPNRPKRRKEEAIQVLPSVIPLVGSVAENWDDPPTLPWKTVNVDGKAYYELDLTEKQFDWVHGHWNWMSPTTDTYLDEIWGMSMMLINPKEMSYRLHIPTQFKKMKVVINDGLLNFEYDAGSPFPNSKDEAYQEQWIAGTGTMRGRLYVLLSEVEAVKIAALYGLTGSHLYGWERPSMGIRISPIRNSEYDYELSVAKKDTTLHPWMMDTVNKIRYGDNPVPPSPSRPKHRTEESVKWKISPSGCPEASITSEQAKKIIGALELTDQQRTFPYWTDSADGGATPGIVVKGYQGKWTVTVVMLNKYSTYEIDDILTGRVVAPAGERPKRRIEESLHWERLSSNQFPKLLRITDGQAKGMIAHFNATETVFSDGSSMWKTMSPEVTIQFSSKHKSQVIVVRDTKTMNLVTEFIEGGDTMTVAPAGGRPKRRTEEAKLPSGWEEIESAESGDIEYRKAVGSRVISYVRDRYALERMNRHTEESIDWYSTEGKKWIQVSSVRLAQEVEKIINDSSFATYIQPRPSKKIRRRTEEAVQP